jgi:hypothetical protein
MGGWDWHMFFHVDEIKKMGDGEIHEKSWV